MDQSNAKENILKDIIALIQEISTDFIESPTDLEFYANARFVDLGMNSIDYADIVTRIIEKAGVDIPIDEFVNTNNITDVVNIIHSNIYK